MCVFCKTHLCKNKCVFITLRGNKNTYASPFVYLFVYIVCVLCRAPDESLEIDRGGEVPTNWGWRIQLATHHQVKDVDARWSGEAAPTQQRHSLHCVGWAKLTQMRWRSPLFTVGWINSVGWGGKATPTVRINPKKANEAQPIGGWCSCSSPTAGPSRTDWVANALQSPKCEQGSGSDHACS